MDTILILTEMLNKSINFDAIGIGIFFSPKEQAGVTVSRIELFLGEDTLPIIVYINKNADEPNYLKEAKYGESVASYPDIDITRDGRIPKRIFIDTKLYVDSINSQHTYWNNYFDVVVPEYSYDFQKDEFEDISLIEDLWQAIKNDGYRLRGDHDFGRPLGSLNRLLLVPDFCDKALKKRELEISPDLKCLIKGTENYRNKKLFPSMSTEEQVKIKELNRLLIKAVYPELAPERPLTIHKLWKNLKEISGTEREITLRLLEKLGIDIYGASKEDFLSLRHFLPETLNAADPQYIITENFENKDARSVSLFTLSVSYSFTEFLQNILYIGPLRQSPERFYTFSGIRTEFVGKDGKYAPDILITDKELMAKVNEQFAHLGLDYELAVTPLSSTSSDIQDLLALRLRNKSRGIHIGLTDVGFGISQILPIIAQSILSKEKTILIEQPELHLHPEQQAELGDMFIEAALGENKNTFLIETHSEHLILRIMRRIRETYNGNLPNDLPPIKPDDVAVLYVEQDGKNGSIIREMPLNERGELVKAWPGGFFEEGLREVLP